MGQYFLKEKENMFSVLLWSDRNSIESLGDLEKAVGRLAFGSRSHSSSCSPKLSLLFLQLDRNTVHVFHNFLKNVFTLILQIYEHQP